MLNPCRKCGQSVRSRASHVRDGRRNGVYNYIEHVDGSHVHGEYWDSSMFKPYPDKKEDQPFSQLIAQWNEKNPVKGEDSRDE